MDSRLSSSESPNRWRSIAIALAVLIAVGVGFLIGRASAPEADQAPTESGRTDSPDRETVNGVPVGYERTEEGAVEAATNFARVMASVTSDVDAYREAIRTLAAPAWRDEAEDLADNGLEFLAERYGDGGSFTFSPIRYRVTSYEQSEATIELWGVTVATGPKVTGIEESWLTGTVELVWVNGDWRVAGQNSETGPTPELLQTQDQRAVEVLDEFKEYRRAPAP